MRNIFRKAAVILATTAFVAGCKDDTTPKEKPTPEEPKQELEKSQESDPAATGDSEPHSSSVPGTENQLMVDQKIPEVTFSVTSPKEGQTFESGNLEVTFDLQKYRTGEEIGQHVHVIVDNEPYIAHYDASKPLKLTGLDAGTHTIRAFPARHYHLSLKEGDVFEVVTFHVTEKSEDFAFDPSEPYVTYSRPKGTYSVDAARNLLLDFYVTNATLGKDAKVIYGINGEENELTEWKPILVGPLPAGEHDVTLKLVDMEGNPIENGGYNNTTRKITIE